MKKYYIFTVICLTSLFLFACNNSTTKRDPGPKPTEEKSENVKQNQDLTTAEKEVSNQTEIDLDAFIKETTKVNKGLESFSIEGTIDSIQTFGDEKSHIVKTQEQDAILDPLQIRKYEKTEQQGDPDSESEGMMGEEMTIYTIDGVTYINYKGQFGDGETWYKDKNKYSDDEIRSQESIDVERMLENLDDITLDRTLEVEDDVYILILEIDVDKYTETEKKNPDFAQSDDEKANQKLMETYKIEQMNYQLTFDKESKLLLAKESKKKHSYEMDFNDQTDRMVIEETSVTHYKNQNHVEKVDFPEEIAENAVEMGD